MSCRCVIKFRNFHFAPRSQKWVQKRQIYHLAKSCILNTFNILSSMQMLFLDRIWHVFLGLNMVFGIRTMVNIEKKKKTFFLK